MTDLPSVLAETRDDFLDLGDKDKIQLLIEFAEELPELPPRYADHPELLEKVEELTLYILQLEERTKRLEDQK